MVVWLRGTERHASRPGKSKPKKAAKKERFLAEIKQILNLRKEQAQSMKIMKDFISRFGFKLNREFFMIKHIESRGRLSSP